MIKLDGRFNWLARDKDGELYGYNNKPIKNSDVMWDWGDMFDGNRICKFIKEIDSTYSFIKWEDEEPTKIEDIQEESEQNKAETVNKPGHYIGVNGMEVEEVLQNFLPKYKDPYMSHRVGSAIEYQLRAPEKNGLEDLKKARKNLDQAIEYAERNFKADETILCKPKNNDPYDSFMYSLANLPNKPNWTEYFVPNSNVSTFYGGTNLND